MDLILIIHLHLLYLSLLAEAREFCTVCTGECCFAKVLLVGTLMLAEDSWAGVGVWNHASYLPSYIEQPPSNIILFY